METDGEPDHSKRRTRAFDPNIGLVHGWCRCTFCLNLPLYRGENRAPETETVDPDPVRDPVTDGDGRELGGEGG